MRRQQLSGFSSPGECALAWSPHKAYGSVHSGSGNLPGRKMPKTCAHPLTAFVWGRLVLCRAAVGCKGATPDL